jgi:hypothetical protein
MIEEIFETGAQEIDDEDVVEAFLAKVVDIGDSGCTRRISNQSSSPMRATEAHKHSRTTLDGSSLFS